MKRYLPMLALAVFLSWPFVGAAADSPDNAVNDLLDGIEKRYAGTGFSALFFQESVMCFRMGIGCLCKVTM